MTDETEYSVFQAAVLSHRSYDKIHGSAGIGRILFFDLRFRTGLRCAESFFFLTFSM